MANKIKVKLNKAGIVELFTSPAVNAWIQGVGNQVAGIAQSMSGEGAEYAASSHNADNTAICNVYPNNEEAALDNWKHNTLLKARSASGLPSTKPKL